MNSTSFKIGDEVIINPDVDRAGWYTGVIFTVVKVPTRANEVNYVLAERDDPGRHRLKTRGRNLCSPSAKPTVTVTDLPYRSPYEPPLRPGTLVTMSGKDGYFIVVATTPRRPDEYRLFPLGGSDRYWKNVPRSSLTVIDVSRVIIA